MSDQARKFPAILGRVKGTHEFYADAAERAVKIAGEAGDAFGVALTFHGFLVVEEIRRIHPKFFVMAITHKTDPDHLADTMAFCARETGFDTGVRKGRRPGGDR